MSVDSPKLNAALGDRLQIDIPLYQDPGGAAAASYGLFDENKGINQPSVVVIAPGGTIIWQYIGDSPKDRPLLARILKALDDHRAAQ